MDTEAITAPVRMHFRWVEEERPGPMWRGLFSRTWTAYRQWFLVEGDDARPSLDVCSAELSRHMPELVPMWNELAGLVENEQAARMLSLVDPAPYLSGCSQAVWPRGRPLLVRNYDYRPDACEGVFLLSRWHETRVLASSDCLWGALDGINEHGLCVALSFGGSRSVGAGFGIPLILRYVLEFCDSVESAAAVLRRVPSHMAYNVSLLDARGEYAVAQVAPDRPTVVVRDLVSTNHQRNPVWTEYAKLTRSRERRDYLEDRLAGKLTGPRFSKLFLDAPLYADRHAQGYGTLYTACYRPDDRSVTFMWPARTIEQRLDAFAPTELVVSFP